MRVCNLAFGLNDTFVFKQEMEAAFKRVAAIVF